MWHVASWSARRHRLLWFIGLWALGVAVTLVVAGILKAFFDWVFLGAH